MDSRRIISTRWSILLVFVLLGSFTAASAIAQPGAAPPSDAQVIAQGIDTLSGNAIHWQIETLTAAHGVTAEFGAVDTGFTVGSTEPVIVTERGTAQSALLNPGQARFHTSGSAIRVSSSGATDAEYQWFALTTDMPQAGVTWQGDVFTAPTGTYNIQLTRDGMRAGEVGDFSPANDLPSMLSVSAGNLQVTDAQGTMTELSADGIMQFSGDISLLAGSPDGATWMIASIGEKVDVPPMPTLPSNTPVPPGSLFVNLLECPSGSDPLADPSVCAPSTATWDITLTPQGSTDDGDAVTMSEDGVDLGDSTWRFPELKPVTWVVQPQPIGANIDLRFEITGDDIVPLGGTWGVKITSAQESVIDVYLIGDLTPTQTGGLTIHMYDCPPGIDPIIDASQCTLTLDAPNVEISQVMQSEVQTFHSQGDAHNPEPGVFIFYEIPSGLYQLQANPNGIWPEESIVLGGDAYFDVNFSLWSVMIPVDGSMRNVVIYHLLDGPIEPTPAAPNAVGYLEIHQIDCPSGTTGSPISNPECWDSGSPWDVSVENVNTGETWWIYMHATEVGAGRWMFELPEGYYTIYVPADPVYTVYLNGAEQTSMEWTVTAGETSTIGIYSIAP